MSFEVLGAKHFCEFEALAQKYDFKIMREGGCYRLCAENKDHEWVPWVGFYPELDLASYFGKTDFLNIWLCDTRKDFTPEKCMSFVHDLNCALELTEKNRFFVCTLIDSKDWQNIARVCDALADKRYLSNGVLEPGYLGEIEGSESLLSERIQSASFRTATALTSGKTPEKEPDPER